MFHLFSAVPRAVVASQHFDTFLPEVGKLRTVMTPDAAALLGVVEADDVLGLCRAGIVVDIAAPCGRIHVGVLADKVVT